MSKAMPNLESVSPEPVSPEDIPKFGIPTTPSFSSKLYSRSVSVLSSIQKYSTIPFSCFYVMHLSAFVLGPALTNIEISEQLLSMGRAIYQAPIFEEVMVYGSVIAHVTSGILIRILKRYRHSKINGKVAKSKKSSSVIMNKSSSTNDNEIKDKDYGLGGITSLFGLGSRKSISSRWLGLSPLEFSGYLLTVMIIGHVFHMRIVPILLDGDSSLIDLSFISHSLHREFKPYVVYPLIVLVSSYHIFSGWNRYLKRFTLSARRAAYVGIVGVTSLALVSLFRISYLGPTLGGLAKRFDAYIDY